MRKTIVAAGAGLVMLPVLALLIPALSTTSRQMTVEPVPILPVVQSGAAERLAGALRFRTISHSDRSRVDAGEFRRFNAYLQASFPRVHARLQREVVNELSLLYTWPGSDPSLRPVLLMAHSDAVPVEPGTETEWTHPPFEGRVADGYVWGRGVMDDKGSLLAILEAVEALLAGGFAPERTIYLAFGHDEEIGGSQGAARIVERLRERDVRLEFVLDEGREIWDERLLRAGRPTALVALAEKGYMTLQLVARSEGGHSSMPPRQTAVGVLSAAIAKLESAPVPARFEGPIRQLLDYLAPELPMHERVMFANPRVFAPLLDRRFSSLAPTNSLVRTTTAATVIGGGVKDNVLPQVATAQVNFRLQPGDRAEDVVEHVRRVIDDPRVEVRPPANGGRLASPSSSTGSLGFQAIQKTVSEIAPEVVVLPAIFFGTTDSRHFAPLTDAIYRFLPIRLDAAELSRYHSTDERMSLDNYALLVTFYHRLLLNSTGSGGST